MILDYTNKDDEALITMLQSGEGEAFTVLLSRHSSYFYGVAYRICNDKAAAEDIVQDAFLKLWRRPESYQADKGASFKTWFYRVVYNIALDGLRKTKQQKTQALDNTPVADSSGTPFDNLAEAEQQDLMENAIQALSERQKAALNMCFYDGLSNKDAADILGVSVKALESLLMRAKANIKTYVLG